MMSNGKTIRAAAVQYHVGGDVEANLATTLRMLDEAAKCQPDLIVLPEFCNHLSWYADKQHCFDVSVSLDGSFLTAVAAKAAELKVHVVVNCTVQRADNKATGSSLLYSPEGKLLADNTKQIYIGHENDFLERATEPGPITQTDVGRLGLYACMDGVINETPRTLALRHSQIMCNSLNSFALDEGSMHIPVRAAENRVWVVAANKIGPLVPDELVVPISEQTGIPPEFLGGAGDSQIVSPDGVVVAHAKTNGEEVVFADIDVSEADNKCRPDGTDVFASRRPELYGDIARDPASLTMPDWIGADSAEVALVAPVLSGSEGLAELLAAVADQAAESVAIVAAPPLLTAQEIAENVSAAEVFSVQSIKAIAEVCGDSVVSTSLVLKDDQGANQYCAVLIGSQGLVLKQGLIHASKRFSWSSLSDVVETVELAIGRVGLVTTDDSIYPETFRLLAMKGVEVAAVALEPLQDWELQTGLLERSAENRINLLVAARASSHGAPFVTALQKDFTVMTPWQERAFDGLLSQPVWLKIEAGAATLRATIFPACSANKEVSRNTDLLDGRPWDLAGSIVS